MKTMIINYLSEDAEFKRIDVGRVFSIELLEDHKVVYVSYDEDGFKSDMVEMDDDIFSNEDKNAQQG